MAEDAKADGSAAPKRRVKPTEYLVLRKKADAEADWVWEPLETVKTKGGVRAAVKTVAHDPDWPSDPDVLLPGTYWAVPTSSGPDKNFVEIEREEKPITHVKVGPQTDGGNGSEKPTARTRTAASG